MYDAIESWSRGNISSSKEILDKALSGIAFLGDISSMRLMYARILMAEGDFSTAQLKLKNVLFVEPQRIEPSEFTSVFSKLTSDVATESDVHIEGKIMGMMHGKEYFYTPTDIVKIGKEFYCLDNSNKTLIGLSQALSIEKIINLNDISLPVSLGKTLDNKLLVIDYTGSISVLDPSENMKVITKISTPIIVAPIGSVLDRNGDLYVLDQAKSTIEVFSPQFLHLRTIHPFSDTSNLTHISINKHLSVLYVIDMDKKRIAVIDNENRSHTVHFFHDLVNNEYIIPISLEISPYSNNVFILWSDGKMKVYDATLKHEIGNLKIYAPEEISTFHIFGKRLICLYRRLNMIYSYDIIFSGIGELPWIVGIDPEGFPAIRLYVRISNAINRTVDLMKDDIQVWENNVRCNILKVEEVKMNIRVLICEGNRNVNVKGLTSLIKSKMPLTRIVKVKANLSDIVNAISPKEDNFLIISSEELNTLMNKVGKAEMALIMKIDNIRPVIIDEQITPEIKAFLYKTNGCLVKVLSNLPFVLNSLNGTLNEVIFKTKFIISDSNTRDVDVVYRGKVETHLDYIYYLPVKP